MTADGKTVTEPINRPPGTVDIMFSEAEIEAKITAVASEIASTLGPDIMVVAVLFSRLTCCGNYIIMVYTPESTS